MGEELLHAVWENQAFDHSNLLSTDGSKIEVRHPGFYNIDAGPDFFAARISIDGQEWVGNVEIHLNASEWFLHGHDQDEGYDNVVLHVVFESDVTSTNTQGAVIKTIELKSRLNPNVIEEYAKFKKSKADIPCSRRVKTLSNDEVKEVLHAYAEIRMRRKAQEIVRLVRESDGNIANALYLTLGRAFGFRVNALPFSLLVASLPLKVVLTNRDNPFVVESLFFGVAGMLEEQSSDTYHYQLQREFNHQQHKYKLNTLSSFIWKYSRMRPNNFPSIRIGQFAHLMSFGADFISQALYVDSVQEAESLLNGVEAHPYWRTHHKFGEDLSVRSGRLGLSSIHTIIINVLAPYQWAVGEYQNDNSLKRKAIGLLASLPSETNRISSQWKKAGVTLDNAKESQGGIELKNEMCAHKKCVSCALGAKLILNHDKVDSELL